MTFNSLCSGKGKSHEGFDKVVNLLFSLERGQQTSTNLISQRKHMAS